MVLKGGVFVYERLCLSGPSFDIVRQGAAHSEAMVPLMRKSKPGDQQLRVSCVPI